MLDEREALSNPWGSRGAPPTLKRSHTAPTEQLQVPMRWPVRLVIVRHGQSEQNAALDLLQASSLPHLLPLHFFSEKLADQRLLPAKQPDIDKLITIRDADIKLTPLGVRQASETGKYLAGTKPFDVCFCSPYWRTQETGLHPDLFLLLFIFPLAGLNLSSLPF